MRVFWIAFTAAACGGSSPVAQTATGLSDQGRPPPVAAETAARVASAAPIPDAADGGERVLFLREGSIWTMRPDGDDASEILPRADAAPHEAPSLGPGGRFAFSSTRDGTARIYVASLEEGIAHPITNGADGGDREPALSPDGQWVAFVRGDPRESRGLYVVAAGGGAPRALVSGDDDHPAQFGAPAWSPDGRLIAFSADRRRGQGTLLWLVDTAGTLRPLTRPRPKAWFVQDRRPAWSPDGTRVAFASNRHVPSADHAGDFDIYTVSADGSDLQRITDDPGIADDPAYAPDGKRLFFTSTRGLKNSYEVEIYVMPATGGDQRRLSRVERPQNAAPSTGIVE